ncbi:hypothetical protein ACHAW6_008557 [Cyclotella cf. meneghiniana]
MLSFIITVCNGDLNSIKHKHTCLTWYKEWFLYFEHVWNQSLTRIKNVSKTYWHTSQQCSVCGLC